MEEINLLSGKQFHPNVVKSAVVVLKDVNIDENINQLPKSKLEEERFAYFFRDTLSEVYNQNYLEVILTQNSNEVVFKNMVIFSLKNFSLFNKKNGWGKGDDVLKKFAFILSKNLEDEMIFRVFGDDFIILGKSEIEFIKTRELLDDLMLENSLSYSIDIVDLTMQKIDKLEDIERVYIT
jgi:diguanylate cyclase (GGDEF)-like protein